MLKGSAVSSDREHRKMKSLTRLSSRIRRGSIKGVLPWPWVSQQVCTVEWDKRATLVWHGLGNDTRHQPRWLLPNALISGAKDSNHWCQQLWGLLFKTCDLVSTYWRSHSQAACRLSGATSYLRLLSLLVCRSFYMSSTGKVYWTTPTDTVSSLQRFAFRVLHYLLGLS